MIACVVVLLFLLVVVRTLLAAVCWLAAVVVALKLFSAAVNLCSPVHDASDDTDYEFSLP